MIKYHLHVWNNDTVNQGQVGTDSQVTWYDVLLYTNMTLEHNNVNTAIKKDVVCGSLVNDVYKVCLCICV